MADNIRATPRNELLGLLSDAMYGGINYMKDPRRSQQMQGLAGLLESTGIPQTTQRMAYGEPLTNIGRANVPLLKPETADAMMNIAPFAPAVGRLASRAVRATDGMPVGMGIKDVGKSAITREGNPIQGAVVLVGDKIFMGRTHGDALNRAVYEGVVRKEGGKYIYPKGAEVNSDLFMTKDGQIIDRLQASKMFDIGASETAIEKGLMQNNPPKSMTVDSYIEQATALKKQREQSPYPQQAALDLAQQRAALPVEQGGLGLPANNTAADRAKAMGFDTPAYRGYQFGTGKNKNTFYTDNPEIASQYALKSGGAQYEINTGGERYLFDTLEEAKRAQKTSTGGKIIKLKNSPTIEANLLRMENPLVVDAKQQNWNWLEDPFKPKENLQALQQQLNDVTEDKIVNGQLYTIDQQKQDILRSNYFKAYTDTNRLAEEARKKGYSNTVIQNVYDTALPIEGDKSNYLSNVYVSSNPENVRSRFAAFDPFRKDVATAAAMGVAAPNLLAAEPTPEEIKRRQSSGLLSP